jgi:hypothetical protein
VRTLLPSTPATQVKEIAEEEKTVEAKSATRVKEKQKPAKAKKSGGKKEEASPADAGEIESLEKANRFHVNDRVRILPRICDGDTEIPRTPGRIVDIARFSVSVSFDDEIMLVEPHEIEHVEDEE